ncbi:MAG: efflux RND transporter permease subunit [Marinilabiliaceae bacterium]|nr:efflux RND transporter permease subunit [Marinilabiliaceae bacterium]
MSQLVDRRVLVSMIFIALTMLGWVSYKQLAMELLPNTEFPMLFVRVSAPSETDPKYVEQQGVIPIEGVISSLENIEKIESRVNPGSATIIIYLEKDANVTYNYLKLVERIENSASLLPDDFSANVFKVDVDQASNQFMRIQARADGGVDRVRNLVEDEVVDRLENIDGVASLNIYGGRVKTVDITVNDQLMESYGLTLGVIRQRIVGQQTQKVFAGLVKENKMNFFVTVEADYNSIDDIENIVLRADGPVRLKDVATVSFDVKEEDSYSRVNGKDAVTLTLARESKVNLISLSEKVLNEIDEINIDLESRGLELVVEFNSAETMQTNIDKIISLAFVGGLLAVFLLWIFLKNIYLVFVAMVAIPVSVYSAFNVFYAGDVSINILTLVGLALAVGMLIDNNVVVMENIHRLIARKETLRDSVIKGTGQVWRAVVASTLTTITVFVPFVFSTNVMFREVARQISVSIVSTLVISLIVALVLVPVLILSFMKLQRKISTKAFEYLNLHNRLVQYYIQLLKTCLRYPLQIIFGSLAVLFITIFVSQAFNTATSEETETTSFFISVEMPTGSTLETTDIVVRDLESRLTGIAENPDIISQVYEESASLTVRLDKDYKDDSERTIAEIRQDIQNRINNINGAEVALSQSVENGGGGRGFGSNPGMQLQGLFGIGEQTESVIIKGEDYDKMLLVANDVKYYLEENLENLTRVNISASSRRPEVHLGFDPLLMGISGVSPANVASELSTFRTEVSSGGTLRLGKEEYDISLTTNSSDTIQDEKKRMDDLKALLIESSSGGVIPLTEVADINYSYGRSEIQRVNQEKQIEVVYRFSDEVNDSKTLLESSRKDVEDLIALIPLPSGVALDVVHEENPFDEFKFLILVAVILIFMILASVFESLTAPLVMMFTVPLAAIGSLLALTLTGRSLFSLNTLIGFLILLGVVVNNGIILMDYAHQLRRSGMNYLRALIEAGISRIRPVTITAATTIIAMLPLAMGKTEFVGSLGAPFAITVVGGLSFSTVLTLVFIPTFSYGLDSSLRWIRSQNLLVRGVMFLAWVLGLGWLFGYSDAGMVWKMIYLVLFVVGVPIVTWFVLNSLRKAGEEVINPDEPIRISIRNLVKVYDRPGRFLREWQSRRRLIEAALDKKETTKSLLENALWQIPLMLFGVYFTWFYVESGFTLLLSSIILYLSIPLFFTIGSGKQIESWCIKRNKFVKICKWLSLVYHWGFPLFSCVLFYLRWHTIVDIVFILVIWEGLLFVKWSGKKVERNSSLAVPGKSKRSKIRSSYFRTVRQIPLLGKTYRPFKALKSVSLDIQSGMIGLLGPNGAGKTTLMRIVCGILEQSYGKIYINGVDTTLKREELQGLIGYLPQEFGMYENMTAEDFLDYQSILKGLIKKEVRSERIEYVLKSVHMWERRKDTIGSYSGGMKQRIGIAMILLHLPRILVVDEPTAGLDPSERIRFRNLLVELSRDRVVLFSTHIIEDISSSCNQVAVMFKGDLKYWGNPLEMVRFAEGKVWQAIIAESDFEDVNEKYKVVHHVKIGHHVRIRCLSDEKPFDDAEPVKPVLEDAYLLMLKSSSRI